MLLYVGGINNINRELYEAASVDGAKKIQAFYSYYGNVPEMATKSSIFAALQLYLDFINLFVYLLRFVGRRRR